MRRAGGELLRNHNRAIRIHKPRSRSNQISRAHRLRDSDRNLQYRAANIRRKSKLNAIHHNRRIGHFGTVDVAVELKPHPEAVANVQGRRRIIKTRRSQHKKRPHSKRRGRRGDNVSRSRRRFIRRLNNTRRIPEATNGDSEKSVRHATHNGDRNLQNTTRNSQARIYRNIIDPHATSRN